MIGRVVDQPHPHATPGIEPIRTIIGDRPARWPELPWRDWGPTVSTLHMWLQIVGKVRLALAPPLNHWWHVPLYVTARGLTTSPIPYGDREFQVDLDFVEHQLRVTDADPGAFTMALEPRSVARFYREFLAGLRSRGFDVAISPRPVEVADAVPFDRDEDMPRTTPSTRSCCGRRSSGSTACSRASRPASLARPVRFTCSGAASICPRRVSRGEPHRAIRAASPTARTGSWQRPNRTRTSPPAGGR